MPLNLTSVPTPTAAPQESDPWGSGNPEPLAGSYPPFLLSVHPWQDLCIDESGALSCNPAKDEIEPGTRGIVLSRSGLDSSGVYNMIRKMKRLVIENPKSYSYRYRVKDDKGPEQWLDRWTRVKWVAEQACFEHDLDGYYAWLREVAASLNPSPEQISQAETRSGRKLTVKAQKGA